MTLKERQQAINQQRNQLRAAIGQAQRQIGEWTILQARLDGQAELIAELIRQDTEPNEDGKDGGNREQSQPNIDERFSNHAVTNGHTSEIRA